MSTETIQIAYTGEALQTGTMDVLELAPALLAVGNLCKSANRVLNGNRAEVAVFVRSDFERGSFKITLDVVQDLAQVVQMTLGPEPIKSAAELLQLLGFVAQASGVVDQATGDRLRVVVASFLKLFKLFKGRELPTPTTTINQGNITINIEGTNNHVEIRPDVARLYQDPQARAEVTKLGTPLKQTGIERLEVRDVHQPDTVIESIDKSDMAEISTETLTLPEPVQAAEIEDEGSLRVLEIVKPWLRGRRTNKWTFSDGRSSLNAVIDDPVFLSRLQRREVQFLPGQLVDVKLVPRPRVQRGKLKTEYVIKKVVRGPYDPPDLFPPP